MGLKDIQEGGILSARELRRLGRTADAARPIASYSSAAAATQLAGGIGSVEAGVDWFLAKISGSVTGGYTFTEQWVDGTGAVADKPSGRVNSSNDPAVAVNGATLATNDIVLVRTGRGAGGLFWEASPLGASASSSPTSPWKNVVRFASSSNETISTLANGGSFNGSTLATGDRFAVFNQTTTSENGIYVCGATAPPTRAADADDATYVSPGELSGATVFVWDGALAGTVWGCTTTGAISAGTSPTYWRQLWPMKYQNNLLSGTPVALTTSWADLRTNAAPGGALVLVIVNVGVTFIGSATTAQFQVTGLSSGTRSFSLTQVGSGCMVYVGTVSGSLGTTTTLHLQGQYSGGTGATVDPYELSWVRIG